MNPLRYMKIPIPRTEHSNIDIKLLMDISFHMCRSGMWFCLYTAPMANLLIYLNAKDQHDDFTNGRR